METDSNKFRSDECYMIISDKAKIIYVWTGLKCNVRKRFLASRYALKIRDQKGLQYHITFFKEGEESPEFKRLVSGLKESFANENKDDDDDNFPFPYIIKPPEPPGDLKVAPQSQVHSPRKVKDTKEEFNCQYCGMKLTREEIFTHNCRKSPE